MRNRLNTKPSSISASIMLTVILLSVTFAVLPTSNAVLGTGPATGAIWTTDPDGGRVNGNLYDKAKDVHLAGGPHKKGTAGLPDGNYYFQVTDPAGKMLLSEDAPADRMFTVENGIMTAANPPGTHAWNLDETRGEGIVVQLWPFTFTPKTGGVYKVWVTHEDNYNYPDGCFGFIPSLSKTDNFKVGRAIARVEVPKYFELWVTNEISWPEDAEFWVNYTVAGDEGPILPWAEGIYDRTEGGYDIYRDEATFALGTSIYWKFFIKRVVTGTIIWFSEIYGPELIEEEGMVNKEYARETLGLTDTSDNRCELSSFRVVFTPCNDGSGLYKLSSTNPGSFYYNVLKFGEAGNDVVITVSLPPDGANDEAIDSPNFVFHHSYIGSTPVVDFHVYAGRLSSPCGSQFVPDPGSDITNQFNMDVQDDKNAIISGQMPDSEELLVTVHIDYLISASLTWSEVQSFNDFTYILGAWVEFSGFGVTQRIPAIY